MERRNKRLYAFDADAGTKRWEIELGGAASDGIAGANNWMYFGTGKMFPNTEDDLSQVWVVDLENGWELSYRYVYSRIEGGAGRGSGSDVRPRRREQPDRIRGVIRRFSAVRRTVSTTCGSATRSFVIQRQGTRMQLQGTQMTATRAERLQSSIPEGVSPPQIAALSAGAEDTAG